MNILYVLSGINSFGGIESFCKAVVPLVDFDKYHIDFLVTQNEPIGENDLLYTQKGCRIYRIESGGGLRERIKHKKDFFKNLKTSYDIVHIHTVLTTAYYFAKLAKKYAGAKVIVHSHTASNYDGSSLKNSICRPLLNKYVDYRVACSKNAAKFLFGDRIADKSQIIYNPVNISAFKYSANARNKIRTEIGLAEDEFVLLIVGRLATAKNHEFLLKVFKEVCAQKKNVTLLICGDGEKRTAIEDQIQEMKLSDRVCMLGLRKDVSDIMSASDAFVLPSLYEGLPIVLIEAQANGLPILYSDSISGETIVDISANKLSIKKIKPWVETITKLAHRSNNRGLVDENLLFDIKQKFSSESIALQITELYSDIKTK